MPRSSRHKSHKQNKHGSKDVREHSDSEEDLKMKDRNNEEGSHRVSRDSVSGEKRKVASQSRDGKDPSSHGNGDTSEEHAASKRRKEKADGNASSDRWNGGGDERGQGITISKEMREESSKLESDKSSKSKVSVDSKSKTSRKHDNFSEKEENVSLAGDKEESKSNSRADLKRKSEKDPMGREVHQYKESKESKDKERGSEKERKVQDIKRDVEARAVDSEVARKQGSRSTNFGEEPQGKRGRENTELPNKEELQNPESEKELDKRIRKRRDCSNDKDKYQEHVRESDDRRLSSRGERVKDGKDKYERHRDGSYGDKNREDGDREDRHREDGVRENRHRDDKYLEDSVRDNRHKDDKYREDGDRDNRHRGDKYREECSRDNKHRDDKYREDSDRDNRHRDDKYREEGHRDNRHRDDKYREYGNKDNRHREDKHREDVDRDNRQTDDKQRDDFDREKRFRDLKYRDEHTSRDRISDKSDNVRLRDESNASELHNRKSNNPDGSPSYDDRSTSYKDGKGKRRANDKEFKEEHSDTRYRSTKDQRSDAEKKSMSSSKVASVTDRGRSYSRNADEEFTLNHNRRRSSPSSSSHAAKDHYRLLKQEGSMHRDHVHEERVQHDINSSKEFTRVAGLTDDVSASRSMEKPVTKDDSHLDELSVERRLKSDSRTSPLQLVDKSPSSSSTDRRHSNKSDVRRSLDVEECGQRSGGSRDARDYSDKEGRGSRELFMETLPVDELSQADGDTLSVSSPFSRASRLPGNSKSLLPPPPFRMGVDNHLVFGSSEDDNRGKLNNRHRRIGDFSMGRVQGSAWKGVPNWPSPMANGFIPLQPGPPPVGFHPVMQQFPVPPMFGVRPSMELNHAGVPYHIADSDRFSGHGRPLGWRNPVDDSCPPALHGWDANNAISRDESHIYGRPDWDRNRTLTNGRGWETSGDMWKEQNGMSTEMPSAPQKQDNSDHEPADKVWTGRLGQQDQNEQNLPCLQAERLDISLEAPKTVPEENPNISKTPRKDGDRLWHVYLSKLDLSADLTQPELYNQCTSFMDMDRNTISDEDDSKALYVKQEVIGAKVVISNRTSSASLFAAISDSVFQKALSLYKKQREEILAIHGEKVPFYSVENLEFVPTTVQEKLGLNDVKPGDLGLSCTLHEAECAVSNSIVEKAKLENTFQKLEASPATTYPKPGGPVSPNSVEKSEEPISTLNKVKMEVDLVLNQEKLESIVEEKSLSVQNVEQSDAHSPGKVEDVKRASDSLGNCSSHSNVEPKLVDIECVPLVFSDVSSEACEAVMPGSIESGSVNLSRRHHSSESTH
ncbi:hypothetical protein F0562_035519 [Nyssa sinensis]|uniref:Uncharacterized protein n=1 Tax=Nyssa sinensis TaxID=561372 RepID=A0A5J5ACD8_9ASTE|nr:hypothetical protein F0562_035519 [Nyssa sinensis]